MAWDLMRRPFQELTTLRDDMERVWDSFFKDWRTPELMRGEWAPSLDVVETKDNYVVKAELPGMEAKDIDISLSNGILTIKGEKKQEKEEKDENYHRVECSYGSFVRSVRLPEEVKTDHINAKYKDGVLKVTLPKLPEAKSKQIKVKVE